MTDYDNYAGIFTCQKLAFSHRQSASILSRLPNLDKMYVDKVRAIRAMLFDNARV
jgi:apolipoprotein D and lipocalin family protein